MKDKSILIILGGHLATAPRAQKEAKVLHAAGANVTVCGAWWNSALAQEDVLLAAQIGVRFFAAVDTRDGAGVYVRVLQRLAKEIFTCTGFVTPRAFGTGAPELLAAAKKIRADLTIVHSEAGLWVAKKLVNQGKKVGVDFEDWFSQDLPAADRKQRPVNKLQELERFLLKHASYCLATTQAMSCAMAADANTDRLPVVIPNCFPASERAKAMIGTRDEVPPNCVSFHWFSQTIGPGRGLETLAQAVLLLTGNWRVSLRGDIRNYGQWFKSIFSESLLDQIEIVSPVENSELLARTMSHSVGLALEIPYCASRDLTATNKIFEYMRAGLAIIATNTQGQLEVMNACPNAGIVINPDNPVELAAAMQGYIDDRARLANSRAASKKAGEKIWAWETYEEVLLNTVGSVCISNRETI